MSILVAHNISCGTSSHLHSLQSIASSAPLTFGRPTDYLRTYSVQSVVRLKIAFHAPGRTMLKPGISWSSGHLIFSQSDCPSYNLPTRILCPWVCIHVVNARSHRSSFQHQRRSNSVMQTLSASNAMFGKVLKRSIRQAKGKLSAYGDRKSTSLSSAGLSVFKIDRYLVRPSISC